MNLSNFKNNAITDISEDGVTASYDYDNHEDSDSAEKTIDEVFAQNNISNYGITISASPDEEDIWNVLDVFIEKEGLSFDNLQKAFDELDTSL